MSGCVCLISITLHKLFISERQILENLLLMTTCVGGIWMWVMVNQERVIIRDMRNIERHLEQEDMELVVSDDKGGARTDNMLEVEDTIEIV